MLVQQRTILLLLSLEVIAVFPWDLQLPLHRGASLAPLRHHGGGILDDIYRPQHDLESTSTTIPLYPRRDFVEKLIFLSGASLILPAPFGTAYAAETDTQSITSPIVYQKVLGQGSYKTVYKVSAGDDSFAMAVEKVSSKADVRGALRGIRIAEQLENKLAPTTTSNLQHYPFERVVTWWFQSTPLSEFASNRPIATNTTSSIRDQRTSTPPTKFLGRSHWLVAIKPLYDIDLGRFQQRMPRKYRVGDKQEDNESKNSPYMIAGAINLDDSSTTALRLVYDSCEAGRKMHAAGLIHRDIKPSNIMLQAGKPVVIDFGFSQFVSQDKNGDLCIKEPGKIRGDPHYMIASDAALYKGCASGDTYAMGKTLYEVIFGARSRRRRRGRERSSSSSSSTSSSSSSSSSGKTKVLQIRKHIERFQAKLANAEAFDKSRFRLSNEERDVLRDVIRGLCRSENPFSLEEAVSFLHDKQMNSG